MDRNPPGKVQRVRAGAAGEGQRLDNFLLRALAGVPRSRVYRLLRLAASIDTSGSHRNQYEVTSKAIETIVLSQRLLSKQSQSHSVL